MTNALIQETLNPITIYEVTFFIDREGLDIVRTVYFNRPPTSHDLAKALVKILNKNNIVLWQSNIFVEIRIKEVRLNAEVTYY